MGLFYGPCLSRRQESSLCFRVGDPRFFPRVATTVTSKHFVKLGIIVYFRIYYRKSEVKMTLILFKFNIYPSCKRALNNGRVKSQVFRKSTLNFTFGRGSCLTSDFARPNSNKAILL